MTDQRMVRRDVNTAATTAQQVESDIQQSTILDQQAARRDKLRAQQLLIRTFRTGGRSIFETDKAPPKKWGNLYEDPRTPA